MTRWRRQVTRWAVGMLALVTAVTVATPVSLAAAEEGQVVLSTDFENGSWQPWTQSGGPSLAVVDVAEGKALRVGNRANDYDGIQSPTGILEPGVEYTLTMRAKLAEGTAGSAGVRFVVKPAYTWVGNTTMTADAWATVTGTFTAPAGTDPATLQVYLGTDNLASPYDYLVDDIRITGPAAPPSSEEVLRTDFESGSWEPWTQNGGPTLAVVDADGGKALAVSGRANDYDGIKSPGGLLEPGAEYTFSMRARLAEGTAGTAEIRFVVEPAYTWVGNTAITADKWTTVSGAFTAPADADPATLRLYLGTSALSGGTQAYGYLVDDIVLTGSGGGGGEPWEPTPDPAFVPGGAVSPSATPLAAARGTGKVAALTFDDGPNPGETERLLDVLAANGVTATFCVIGQNVQAAGGAEILRRIVAQGHTLCNHSTSYADMGSWSQAQVEADLKENLAIIRAALGKPNQKVPYFRAPNGSWGKTGEVAAALGMQPLGLGNVIFDWDGNDLSEQTLTSNLRNAFEPGAVILVHDGGGNRENSVNAVETVLPEKIAEGWTFSLPAGGVPGGEVVLSTGFEDGLDGWRPRGDAAGDPTVAVTTSEAHGGSQAALISNRSSQGDGIGHEATGLLTPGVTYEISAWVKFAAGQTPDDVWLSMQRTSGGATSFDTVGQFTGVGAGSWTQVTATYQAPASDSLFLYFETRYPDGSTGSFLVDDIVVRSKPAPQVQDLTPLKDTVAFPVGVAIDERETTGAAAELLTRHFDQITGENHMKPEAWYDASGAFTPHPQADALMRFAQQENLRVYGHTLVWHSQTPAWFFQRADGSQLTTSDADQQVLRDRLRTHIGNVARHLADTYGKFGSQTNPLVAWDVVNEVVSDSGEFPDGMRRSEWYRILGEEFVDLAFRYADEAFNDTYAVDGTSRPITLFINDYNTEQVGKRQRMHALVERLLARGAPVDGVGHQFHVSLSMPVEALEAAIVDFQDLPVRQVITELDVTTGTPVTEASLVEQGYYYRDAFRVFREHQESIFSVTVWGLTDGRSWRSSSGAPLLFDDGLQAKPAYFGAVDGDVPARQRTAFVFRGDVPIGPGAIDALEWRKLPLHQVEDVADFQLRWEPDHLTAYVRVTDASAQPEDAVEFTVGDQAYRVPRDGSGDLPAVAKPVDGGYALVVRLPLANPGSPGELVDFDVRVRDGATTTGWSAGGTLGTLTLVEPLSYTEVVQAAAAPTVDAVVDDAWAGAHSVTTDTQVLGEGGASAQVRTLWRDHTLYVLAQVSDPVLDASGSDPWTQDSVEIFLDAGNVKNGPYRYDDTQIRISYLNTVSFGTGDEAFQQGRVTSATRAVEGGYVVEAAISLLEEGGTGTFHGLDFQVNDAEGGARTAIRTWADPTGLGYQSTARWGVARLVGPATALNPSIKLGAGVVPAGGELSVSLAGFLPGSEVRLSLVDRGKKPAPAVELARVQMTAQGAATVIVKVPRATSAGRYLVVARSAGMVADAKVVVTGARGRRAAS